MRNVCLYTSMGSYLKRHLGFIIFWYFPGEKDRGFHHSFDTKTCGKCYWGENRDFVNIIQSSGFAMHYV